MSQIIITDTNYDLKYEGDYDKNKVAQKIILAVNQAVKDGFSLNNSGWNIKWDEKDKKFKYNAHNFKWSSILNAIILYSNYTTNAKILNPKTKIIAEILNVPFAWVQGFINGLDGYLYQGKINEVINRNSKLSKYCLDGIEIGRLFKFGYLADSIINIYYYNYSKENYNTHQWIDIDENKIALSMGIMQKYKIVQCSQCNMFGGIAFDYWYQRDGYYISNVKRADSYLRKEIYPHNCNEILIKNILE